MCHNRQKQQKTFTTQETRSPSGPDMATCIVRCISKSGIIEQRSNFVFRLHFGRVVGGRGVFSGGAVFPRLFCWVVELLFPLLLLGVAAWPSLLFSSGGVTSPPSRFGLMLCFSGTSKPLHSKGAFCWLHTCSFCGILFCLPCLP